jgi:Mce-associated membrane protein
VPPSRRNVQHPVRRPKVAGLHRPVRHDEDQPGAEQRPDEQPKAATEASVFESSVSGQLTADEPAKADDAPVEDELAGPKARKWPWSAVAGRSPAEVVTSLRPKSWVGMIVLLLVAAVLTAAGFFYRGEAGMVLDGGAAANKALTDTGATTDVVTQVTKDLETVSSYKYTDLDGAQKAGQAATTGKFTGQYNNLFTQVRAQAPAQKAVVSGQVVKIGVRVLAGDNAILLAFMTQTATRADTNTPNSVGLVYTVTAQRVGGKWLISDLTPR